MSAHSDHIKVLCQKAVEHGATRAKPFLASKVIVDPRVRLKCQVPICQNYGRSLMCPPNTITPEQFSIALARYSDAILVQWEVKLDPKLMGSIKDGSIDQLQENSDYSKFLKRSFCDLTGIMNKLEADAMRLGYRFATAFSGGPCGLCEECIGIGHHCRHPFQARPSMEAVGIDVIATAEGANMPIKYPAEQAAALTGLLLID